ncbi:MAG: hypothetical protein GY953_37175, partial [bacterium]|nr:hypothetical protein [bacterium]
NRFGAARVPVHQLITSSGTREKPSHNANVAQSVDITPRLSLHHRFADDTYQLTGFLDATGVLQFINESSGAQLELPIDEEGGTITDYLLARNEAELEYSVTRAISLFGAYRYSDRHLAFGDTGANPRPIVTITHAGGGGFLFRPSREGRVRAEIEKGTASRTFNRIDPLSFLRWKINGQLRPTSKLTVSANAVLEDNRNDTPGVNHDLDNRQVGVNAVFVPSNRLFVSGGYNYLRIRTTTDIVFYALSRHTEGQSLYETNTHVVHALVQAPVGGRVNLRAGYELVRDTGATYPLRMHVPRAGVSVRLHRNVHFDADWRYYSYNERMFVIRDYKANAVRLGLRFTQ